MNASIYDPNASQSSRGFAKGYFAFPPPPPPMFIFGAGTKQRPLPPPTLRTTSAAPPEPPIDPELAERRRLQEEARALRLKQEQEAALEGEMSWVRSGGLLRDAQGRRDWVRTNQMRAEIRLQDEEKKILDRWAEYDARWRTLSTSQSPVTFRDIPWPMFKAPEIPSEITSSDISEFIFAPLGVKSNTVVAKDRIRVSILRWHPDKISSILARVVPKDEYAVLDGVHKVFMTLKELQDAQKN